MIPRPTQTFFIVPNLTVAENIEVVSNISNVPLKTSAVLASVDLADKGHCFPRELSGGKQQRVSIARDIVKNLVLLPCDEPTGALDYDTFRGKDSVVTVLNKRIFRILGENKGRYIGIFILIFLDSVIFAAAKGFGDNYASMVSDFVEHNVQEDLSFSTDRPIRDLVALAQKTGAAIEPYRYYDAAMPGGLELRLIRPGTTANRPAVAPGEGLSQPDDLLIDPFFASNHGIAIGDSIEAGGKIFRVKETIVLPHHIYPLKFINDIPPPRSSESL